MINLIIAIFSLGFLFQCTYHWGNVKQYSLEKPSNLEVVGNRVSGSDGVFLLGWHTQSISKATRDALAKAPGATGLTDVEVIAESYYIYNQIVVTGIPVKEIQPTENNKNKKK